MNKRITIISSIALFIIIIGAIKLKSNKDTVAQKIYIHDSSIPILVSVESPREHTFENSFSYLGVFEPIRVNTITSDASGKVIKLYFKESDHIGNGNVIVKLDDQLLKLQLENAALNVEALKNDDQRNTELIKDNIITGVQQEKTKIALKVALSQLKQLQIQLNNTALKAPFSGVVTKKMIDLGSMIGTGSQILELTDISSVKLIISVPERDVLKFKLGQTVTLRADVHLNKEYKGKVTNISIKGDANHNFKIEITTKNSDENQIMSGMYGSVELQNSKSITALSIPRKALIGSTKKPRVYIVKKGKAKLISFIAGTSDGEYIEVIDGMSQSDRVVIKGQINIQENSNVTIK